MRNFNEIYEKIYSESNSKVEEIRKKEINKFWIIICISIMIAITLYLMNKYYISILILIIASVISLFTIYGGKYNILYKFVIIKSLIEEFSTKLSYKPNLKMSSTLYRDAEFEKYDRFITEDYISGVMEDGNDIKIAEVKTLNEYRDDKGRTKKTTVFHGLFGCIEMKDYIPINLKIHSNKEIIKKFIQSNSRLELDSSEFEKYFDVYTRDEMKGIQILTSDLMIKLIDYRQNLGKEFEITVKNNRIYIRLKCGSVFEADKFKETMDYNKLKKYYDYLSLFHEISAQIIENIKHVKGE